jgi:hypothetical protein
MANFFARVELHGATWPTDYAKLHKAMEFHGFTNCVRASNGTFWQLPTGTYWSTNRIDDVNKVAKAVQQCADSTGYSNEVLVIKDVEWQAFLSSKCTK